MKLTIAIDGHSSCGKSTLASMLAKCLDYIYIDSGAMYRAVAYYFLQHNIDLNDSQSVLNALQNITIDFKNYEGRNLIFLNHNNVEKEIRTQEISNIVSEVAAISAIRRKLVAIQQEMGKRSGIVMDGRDIGSVVFPHAEIKLFVTADIDVRTKRRKKELFLRGSDVTEEQVRENLLKRDSIDSSREDSPLTQTPDAILIDNSEMDRREQLDEVIKLIKEKFPAVPLHAKDCLKQVNTD